MGGLRWLAFVVAFSTISAGQTPKPSQPCVIVERHVHKFGEYVPTACSSAFRLRGRRLPVRIQIGAQNSVTAMFEISSKRAAEWWFSNPITKPLT